jgi:hypothetical protein
MSGVAELASNVVHSLFGLAVAGANPEFEHRALPSDLRKELDRGGRILPIMVLVVGLAQRSP